MILFFIFFDWINDVFSQYKKKMNDIGRRKEREGWKIMIELTLINKVIKDTFNLFIFFSFSHIAYC